MKDKIIPRTFWHYFTLILLIPAIFMCILNIAAGILLRQYSIKERLYTDPHAGTVSKIGLLMSHRPDDTVLFHLMSSSMTIADWRYIYRIRPNPSNKSFYGYTGINFRGFRGKAFDGNQVKSKRETTILVLGDSCAFGSDILQNENTWTYKLKHLLEEKSSPVSIINLGQPGYSTSQGLVLFNDWIDRISPDIVILYFGWNDLWKAPFMTDRQMLKFLKYQNHPMLKWISNNNIYQLMNISLNQLLNNFKTQVRSSSKNGIRVPRQESIENFSDMVEGAHRSGSNVIIISPPFSKKSSLDIIRPYNKAIQQHFLGKAYFPTLKKLRQTEESNFLFSEDGYHLNEKGAIYLAEELASVITTITKRKRNNRL